MADVRWGVALPTDPQDTGLEPVVNPPYLASETAISLNLTILSPNYWRPLAGRPPGGDVTARVPSASDIRTYYVVNYVYMEELLTYKAFILNVLQL